MKPIIQAMDALCEQDLPFALATVISRHGSAPRSIGAKMLVRQDGGIAGTVGGGTLEAQVIQLAMRMIEERRAVTASFQFSGKDAATMDAICGGQVEVLVEWVDPRDRETVEIIRHLQSAISRHQKAWLVTIYHEESNSTSHALVEADGTILGALPDGTPAETITEARLPYHNQVGRHQVIIEPVNIAGTAYLFGAGHVSRSLAQFVKAVGFWTVILDDRKEYANDERFPEADEVIVLDSFSDVLGRISIDSNSFIVIVTRGHLNDLTVLAQVLKSNAGYIGMIGSRRKCELIFQELRNRGYEETEIRRVHAPIGLPINAETPEEIGISVVAEMIQARANLPGMAPR